MKKIVIGLGVVLIVLGIFLLIQKNTKLKTQNLKKDEPLELIKANTKKEILKFAVMADVHNDVDSLNKALDMSSGQRVVLAGDLTINGTENEEEEIEKILDRERFKTVPYYAVPGNHDIYKKIWIFGNKYQSVKEKNVKLILIDNSDWRGLGEEQKNWIEGEVKECGRERFETVPYKMICLAVMHKPLENNFSTHVMGENSKAVTVEAAWLKDLFLKSNVKTGYSGHLHYSSSYTIGGWETVLVGAISKDRNTETPRFTEVTVWDDGSVSNEVKLVK